MSSVSKKIIIVGHFGVGKTSLTKRFVHSIFSEQYLTTIGVNIEQREVQVGDTEVRMVIWDIAGELDMSQINRSYLLGAQGALFVFDVNRPATYTNLEKDIADIKSIIGDVPLLAIGNKADLLAPDVVESFKAALPIQPDYLTSAKSGDFVEEAFERLANSMIHANL